VQVMSYLVYGFLFGFGELARGGREGVFLEEEAYFIVGSEEVFVADVGGFCARGEFCHGVVGEVDV